MDKNLIFIIMLLLILPMVVGVQVNSSTEIYSFNVTGCMANVSTVGCDPADITFSCDISNYNFIDSVLFRVQGTDYPTLQNLNSFSASWHKGVTPTTTNSTISFQRGQIFDVGSGSSLFYPNVNVNLDCQTCSHTVVPGACEIDDTHNVEYIGDGSINCTSFNVTESCDYCTPDWHTTSTCAENGTEFRTYADSNNCYLATGLYSDSCDNSFADCNQEVSCTYLVNDMDCGYDINPLINLLNGKIPWKCSITNASQDFSCISYVKQQGAIIQTNPQQKTYSSGVLPQEQETKEYFTAQNGLLQPYFLTEGLKSNTTYLFGVECSSPSGKLTTEHYIVPMYSNLDVIAERGIWVKDNLGYIIGAVIALIVIIGVVMLVVKQ